MVNISRTEETESIGWIKIPHHNTPLSFSYLLSVFPLFILLLLLLLLLIQHLLPVLPLPLQLLQLNLGLLLLLPHPLELLALCIIAATLQLLQLALRLQASVVVVLLVVDHGHLSGAYTTATGPEALNQRLEHRGRSQQRQNQCKRDTKLVDIQVNTRHVIQTEYLNMH